MPLRVKVYKTNQSGVSLVEVLVAMVILAVGMLGMSALQTSSIKSNQNAYLRTQATFHALDIVERMRSNEQGVENLNYHLPTPATTAACLTGVGCNPSELAAHDVAEWQASIAASLPSGQAIVCLDSAVDLPLPAVQPTFGAPLCDGNGNVYAAKIWWDDSRDGTADLNYMMSFQP